MLYGTLLTSATKRGIWPALGPSYDKMDVDTLLARMEDLHAMSLCDYLEEPDTDPEGFPLYGHGIGLDIKKKRSERS